MRMRLMMRAMRSGKSAAERVVPIDKLGTCTGQAGRKQQIAEAFRAPVSPKVTGPQSTARGEISPQWFFPTS